MARQLVFVAAALACSIATVCFMVVGVSGEVDPVFAGSASACSYSATLWCSGI